MLDFFTAQCCFVPRRAFLPTAAAPMLASWFYQSLPLFSFVFLPNRVGDNSWYMHYGFSVRAALAGAFLMLFFVWTACQSV